MNKLINYVQKASACDLQYVMDMLNSINRNEVIDFLYWNDRNGIYNDEDRLNNGVSPLTETQAKLLAFQKIIIKL